MIVVHTIVPSPHQEPLANELVAHVGDGNFRYVYSQPLTADRRKLGWGAGSRPSWMISEKEDPEIAERLLHEADVLLSGIRDISLFKERSLSGKKTIYMSERWFKPALGFARIAYPRYLNMCRQFVSLLQNANDFFYFPTGIQAACDMARLCGLLKGNLQCLSHAPELEFERTPGGRVWVKGKPRNMPTTRQYCLSRMRMWGYFVEKGDGVRRNGIACLNGQDQLLHCQTLSPLQPSTPPLLHSPTPPLLHSSTPTLTHSPTLRVLWAGRYLGWKRVDTIVLAVGEYLKRRSADSSLPNIRLELYGIGPEENRLRRMAAVYGEAIGFHSPIPIEEVRQRMRENDVYILASNGQEGWGAVTSEALEEGMIVLGTREAGSTATMLPEDRLFNAGDATALSRLLEKVAKGKFQPEGIGTWSASNAAKQLLCLAEEQA